MKKECKRLWGVSEDVKKKEEEWVTEEDRANFDINKIFHGGGVSGHFGTIVIIYYH